MAKRVEVTTDLTAETLYERYRQAKALVERTYWHMLWQVKEGKSPREVAELLGYTAGWVRRMIRRDLNSCEVLIDPDNFKTILTQEPFSRHNAEQDASAAQNELCTPMVIGIFGFTDNLLGISAHLASSTCLEVQHESGGDTKDFQGEGITGAAFRDRKPDVAFKYTAAHELGHTFGLCHVDGLLRIMFTNNPEERRSFWSWSSLWQFWTSGFEAGFTFDEAKKVWDYIVANFSADCLKTRPF